MGAPIILFRTCLDKMASSRVLVGPSQEIRLGCGKKSTAGSHFGSVRRAGDAVRWGKFMSSVSLGYRVQQQNGGSAASESKIGGETVKIQRRSIASKANRSFVTETTEENLQYAAPETFGNNDQFQLGGMVDEVETVDDELEEELAAITSGLTGNLLISSDSVCVGIDPDLSGAIAVLKSQNNCTVAEVIDVPCITVAVNKKMRRRHDYQSIAAIVRQLRAPEGSIAYVEKAMPFPKDGKQGWYITGYGYGVWLGILAAAGFIVVPVPARVWKQAMGLCGKEFTKDDSRALASSMFPVLSPQLRRKKDHGRAEALLIAAFGKCTTATNVASLDEPSSPDRIEASNQAASLTAILSSQEPPF